MKIIKLRGQQATMNEALALLKRTATELSTLRITEQISYAGEVDTTESIYLDRAVQCLEDARVRLLNGGK